MRALSLRQPYTELILRGIETVEYRSRPTRIIGERFYIYATKKKWPVNTADNIVMPTELLPPWTLELANALKLFPHELPTGPASCCRPAAAIAESPFISRHSGFRNLHHMTSRHRSPRSAQLLSLRSTET